MQQNTDLPDNLQGRLSFGEDFALTVHCDNEDTTIENFYIHSGTVIKRKDGDLWFLCHTWTRKWGPDESSSVFVNLRSGEKCVTPSLVAFRDNLTFSSNVLLIDANLPGSLLTRQLIIIDISDLHDINVIYREEIVIHPMVCFESPDCTDTCQECVHNYNCSFWGDSGISFDYILDDQGNNVCVVRSPDPKKITPSSAEKWKTIVNEMRIVNVNYNTLRDQL